jgi:hypothetical protein
MAMTNRHASIHATMLATLLVGATLPCGRVRAAVPSKPLDARPGMTRLSGHVPAALEDAVADTSGESADTSPPLTVTLVLKRDDPAGFARYLHDVYDPRSRRFRKFLTLREITEKFGPSRRTYERTLAYLRANGLELVQGSADRLTITVRGDRRAIARAFDTHVVDYRLGSARFQSNDVDPALPTALAAHVQAVTGLSDLARPRAQIKHIAETEGNLFCAMAAFACFEQSQNREIALYDECLNAVKVAVDTSGTTPQQIADAVSAAILKFILQTGQLKCNPNLPIVAPVESRDAHRSALSLDGTGQKIGLLEFDTFDPNDVADYLALLRLPASRQDKLSQVHVNGGAPAGPDQQEVLLDIDIALSLAPGASIVVYDAPFAGPGVSFQSIFNKMIGDGVTVISNSWAYCEDQTTAADVQSIDTILQTAAAAGITVFNGAGDTGSTCLDGSANTAAVPADSPNATAVGGSSLTSGPSFLHESETWWDGHADVPPTGQGGFGVSKFFNRPGYQDALTGASGRSIPDLVVNADVAKGVVICQQAQGGCPVGALYGGTSAAAPILAALTANLNQELGHNVGALNPLVYPLAGTDAFRGATTLGSDFAHVGLGTPNMDAILRALGHQTLGPPSATNSEFFGALDVASIVPGAMVSGVPADGVSKGYLVVDLLDANGHPLAGKTVSLAASPPGSAVIAATNGVTTGDNGIVVFTMTDLVTESTTVTATDTTDGVVLTQTVGVQFEVPSAAAAGINAFPATVTADGASITTITVTLKDALNRPTPGKTITLSQGTGHSVVTGPDPSVTDAGGQIQFTATDGVNEVVTYTAVDASDGDLPVPGSAQVTFNNGAGTACGNATPPTAAPGFALTAFANGFVAGPLSFGNVNFSGCSGISPPAFRGANAFDLNFLNGDVFKLPASGGAASNADKIGTVGPTLGWPVVGPDGSLYASRVATTGDFTTGAVLQLDPDTGAVIRAVSSNLKCPQGLALDPLSGDLFVDGECFGAGSDDPNIYRIRNPSGASPTTEVYATLPSTPNGDLAFAPNGSLYVVTGYTNTSAPVIRVSGTNGPTPASVTPLAGVVSNYWVNVGEVGADGEARSLVTLTADVTLSLTDITANPPTSTPLVHNLGGGRTGPDGCLYSSSGDGTTVYKLTDAAGGCSFAAVAGEPSLALSPGVVTPNPAQGTSQSFTATLRNVATPAGTPIFFHVPGTNARTKMVRADASGQATFSYTGEQAGDDVVIADSTVGNSSLMSRIVRLTWDPGKHVTSLSLNPSPTSGAPGVAVGVVAALTDQSLVPPAPVAGASIAFSLASAQCAGSTDANGLAICQLMPSELGTAPLAASFAGTADLLASSDTVGFAVTCPAGLGGVTCYLTEFKDVLGAAASTDVKRSVKRQLLAKEKGLEKLVTKAEKPGKPGARSLKKLKKKLDALVKKLQHLPKKKIAAALDATLVSLVQSARAVAP